MDNMNKSANFKLDELDLMLAKELELDARQSNRVLAKKLATSEATVRRRLQRLLDEGIITIVTVPDRQSLGFPIGIDVGLKVSPGKADEVAEYLRSHKRIQNILLATGRYDILIHAALRDINEQNIFLGEDLSRVPYLLSAETIFFVEVVKMSWKYLNDDTYRYKKPMAYDLDDLDFSLIKELELCPRESVTELGRKLGVNRILVGRRLRKLLAADVIRVVSIANPSCFGFNVQVFIFVKVQPARISSVANSLIGEKRILHICTIAGRFDLFLSAAFGDLAEMSDFIMNQLASYPGVISYETMIQVAFAKRSYSLLT